MKTVVKDRNRGKTLKTDRKENESPIRASMTVEYGPDRGRVFETAGDQPCVIGRHSHCDVQLTDMDVSRRHAVLTLDDQSWHLTDLSSQNGSTVNGQDIKQCAQLKDDDQIQVGLSLLRFHTVPKVAAAAEGGTLSSGKRAARKPKHAGAGHRPQVVKAARKRNLKPRNVKNKEHGGVPSVLFGDSTDITLEQLASLNRP